MNYPGKSSVVLGALAVVAVCLGLGAALVAYAQEDRRTATGGLTIAGAPPTGKSLTIQTGASPVTSHVAGDIIFSIAGVSTPCLVFKPDGGILVQGRLAAADLEVVAALREFLRGCTMEGPSGRTSRGGLDWSRLHDMSFMTGRGGKNGDGGDVRFYNGFPVLDIAPTMTQGDGK